MEDGEHREGVRGAPVSYTGKNDQSASGGGSSGLMLALSGHIEAGGDGA